MARVNRIPGMAADSLAYLDKTPFSARFYSQGEARTIDADLVIRRLEKGALTEPMALAVAKGDKAMLQRLKGLADPIHENRRYRLFLLEPRPGSTAGGANRESKTGGIDYTVTNDQPLS